jgi:hypothetical protein
MSEIGAIPMNYEDIYLWHFPIGDRETQFESNFDSVSHSQMSPWQVFSG